MQKILILYYSRTGNTKKMAEFIAEGAVKESVQVEVKTVHEANAEDLLGFDGIVIGSPTYYGTMAAEIKSLIDASVKYHTRLAGKVAGAFTSSAHIGGGNETTILDILNAMLIHGMIIQGDAEGDHYGPVSVGSPDNRVRKECVRFGQRIALLVKKLA